MKFSLVGLLAFAFMQQSVSDIDSLRFFFTNLIFINSRDKLLRPSQCEWVAVTCRNDMELV